MTNNRPPANPIPAGIMLIGIGFGILSLLYLDWKAAVAFAVAGFIGSIVTAVIINHGEM